MPLWHIPFAMSGQVFSAVTKTLTFSPSVPCPYVLPVLVTGGVGTLTCSKPASGARLSFDLLITLGKLDVATLAVLGEGGGKHAGPAALAAGQTANWESSSGGRALKSDDVGPSPRLQPVTGDFLLQATISRGSGSGSAQIIFDSGASTSVHYALSSAAHTIDLVRVRGGKSTTVQTRQHTLGSGDVLQVELLRRGTFYLLYLGSHLTTQPVFYVERPSSDVICLSGQHRVDPELEPLVSHAGVAVSGSFTLAEMRITPYRWEAAALPEQPVLSHCPTCGRDRGCDPAGNKTAACWAYNQIIPGGGLLKLPNGTFVLYVAGSDFDGDDGGGKQYMGVVSTAAPLCPLPRPKEAAVAGDWARARPAVAAPGVPSCWHARRTR